MCRFKEVIVMKSRTGKRVEDLEFMIFPARACGRTEQVRSSQAMQSGRAFPIGRQIDATMQSL